VSVRAAVVGDEHALAALNRFVHEMHAARRPDYFKPPHVDETAAWIAEEEGFPVGYVLTFFQDRCDDPFRRARRWCEIDQIAVDPAWRRRGIGRALMAAALAEAGKRGVREVELSSWAFNTDAHAMFRQFGFEPRVVRFERRAP
jgi:GNAT superfamily N-acetyltransferase